MLFLLKGKVKHKIYPGQKNIDKNFYLLPVASYFIFPKKIRYYYLHNVNMADKK